MFVEFGKSLRGHEDLAADFKQGGCFVLWKRQRDCADGTHIGGDVIAPGAVATRDGIVQRAIAVDQRTGHAIDFRFDGQWDGSLAQAFVQAFVKVRHLFFREEVIDREHRQEVFSLLKGIERSSAHALGGRVGIVEIGMSLFEVLKFAEELIVFCIGNLRCGLLIIETVVAF